MGNNPETRRPFYNEEATIRNAARDLLKAAEGAEFAINDTLRNVAMPCWRRTSLNRELAVLRAAIAKAKGETE